MGGMIELKGQFCKLTISTLQCVLRFGKMRHVFQTSSHGKILSALSEQITKHKTDSKRAFFFAQTLNSISFNQKTRKIR